MFSGLVETKTQALQIEEKSKALRLTLNKPESFQDVKVGHSIAVDGACLTVVEVDSAKMTFELAAETLNITGWSASQLKDRPLNVERALQLGDRLHGHLVLGHVDGTGTVKSIDNLGESWIVVIEFPKEFSTYVIPKGSITMNGVSLTINEVTATNFSVCLIPETWKITNLSSLKAGQKVNLEFDYLAKMIAKIALRQKEIL